MSPTFLPSAAGGGITVLSLHGAVIAAAAGLVAGGVNAVAGGGTLITFPALLATGMTPVTANITSSVGLLSGYAGGSLAYHRELVGQAGRVRALGLVSVLGATVGALLLLRTPATVFRSAVPFLVLLSSILLALQPWLARRVAARRTASDADGNAPEITSLVRCGVFVGAAYGSYFGGGLGVLLLALLGTLLHDGLQRLNALKGLLSLLINAVGVTVFIMSGRIEWPYAAILAVTAYGGGTLGVSLARRLPAAALRSSVVLLGLVVAAVLFIR